jgi:hypothetical protein
MTECSELPQTEMKFLVLLSSEDDAEGFGTERNGIEKPTVSITRSNLRETLNDSKRAATDPRHCVHADRMTSNREIINQTRKQHVPQIHMTNSCKMGLESNFGFYQPPIGAKRRSMTSPEETAEPLFPFASTSSKRDLKALAIGHFL